MIPRKIKKAVIIGYLVLATITWVIGVPAIHSSIASAVTQSYNALRVQQDRPEHFIEVGVKHPYVKFMAAVPIAPGLVVVWYEYAAAMEAGGGVIALRMWYVVGDGTLCEFRTWTS